MPMENEEILQINLDDIIRRRAPKAYRRVPRFAIAAVEKIICQEKLNRLLAANYHLKGVDFSHGILDYLGIKVDVKGVENLPAPGDSEAWRVIFASNHPLGGLDGMALIDLLGSRAPERQIRFIVNDLLMNIPPLQSVFMPVNTMSGRQSRQGAERIDGVMQSNVPVAIFPAGLCSRLVDRRVQDLRWNKMFVAKALQYHRDIIPIHFEGRNSSFFYKFAKLRKMMRIPVNLEMSLLPREVFRNEQATFTITIGRRLNWQSLGHLREADLKAQQLRELVYALPQP